MTVLCTVHLFTYLFYMECFVSLNLIKCPTPNTFLSPLVTTSLFSVSMSLFLLFCSFISFSIVPKSSDNEFYTCINMYLSNRSIFLEHQGSSCFINTLKSIMLTLLNISFIHFEYLPPHFNLCLFHPCCCT